MARKRWADHVLSPVEREQVAVCLARGDRVVEVAMRFACSEATVRRVRAAVALLRRRAPGSGLRLSFEERERIGRGIAAGESDAAIARALGRHRSTVGREIRRCGGRRYYRALRAEHRTATRASRPKPGKLSRSPRLREVVEAGLLACWSPAQISARLKLEYPDDPEVRISHETIYRSLYVQSRGELRRQLTAQLRTGRSTRRSRGRVERRGRIIDMVAISERPPEVEDRAVPGHWEGDLLIGAGRSAIATLVERQTRYVLLARLGGDRTTGHVIEAVKRQIQTLPARFCPMFCVRSGSN